MVCKSAREGHYLQCKEPCGSTVIGRDLMKSVQNPDRCCEFVPRCHILLQYTALLILFPGRKLRLSHTHTAVKVLAKDIVGVVLVPSLYRFIFPKLLEFRHGQPPTG